MLGVGKDARLAAAHGHPGPKRRPKQNQNHAAAQRDEDDALQC